MTQPLLDTFGRIHNNLRVSVTDRCNLRCSYCMEEDVAFMERTELLTFEEITRFVEVAAPLGVDKVRLTGGGALLPGLAGRIESVAEINAVVAEDPLRCVVRGAALMVDARRADSPPGERQ